MDHLIAAMNDLLQEEVDYEVSLSSFLYPRPSFPFETDENGRCFLRNNPNICHFKGFEFTQPHLLLHCRSRLTLMDCTFPANPSFQRGLESFRDSLCVSDK